MSNSLSTQKDKLSRWEKVTQAFHENEEREKNKTWGQKITEGITTPFYALKGLGEWGIETAKSTVELGSMPLRKGIEGGIEAYNLIKDPTHYYKTHEEESAKIRAHYKELISHPLTPIQDALTEHTIRYLQSSPQERAEKIGKIAPDIALTITGVTEAKQAYQAYKLARREKLAAQTTKVIKKIANEGEGITQATKSLKPNEAAPKLLSPPNGTSPSPTPSKKTHPQSLTSTSSTNPKPPQKPLSQSVSTTSSPLQSPPNSKQLAVNADSIKTPIQNSKIWNANAFGNKSPQAMNKNFQDLLKTGRKEENVINKMKQVKNNSILDFGKTLQKPTQPKIVNYSTPIASTQDYYNVAASGGKNYGQYQSFLKQNLDELNKSIKSFEKNIEKHQNWIKNPETKVKDFFDRDLRYQKGLIEKWGKDIKRAKEFKIIAEEVLKRKE